MAVYKYKARDKKGKVKEAIVKAENAVLASNHIRSLGLTLISLKEKKDESKRSSALFGSRGIKTRDISMFTTQLHTLLMAGLAIVSALKALENSTTNVDLAKIIKKVRESVEGGANLSDSFAQNRRYFDELYCNMIKAGEESGNLAEVLQRLAFSIEKEEEIRKRIKSAMSYPIILVVTMVVAVLVLGVFVIPRFAELFEGLNAELPLPTRILLGANYVISNYWYVFILAVSIAGFMFRNFIRTPPGKWAWDHFKIRVFIFGPLFLKIYMARFSYMVSTLIQSGISVIDTFELAGKTTPNVVIAKSIANIKEKVKQGRSIASSMKEEELFPELVIQMVDVGEEAGRVEDLLDQVGRFYEREADNTIDNMTTLIEPVLLFFIAGIVLIMALGIFLPLWNLHGAMTGG